jgi:mannose-6-phosphate isomerase
MRPRCLRPDNLTPPTRTPWGGRKILDHYKRGLDLGAAASLSRAGESWEISVEPSFPSRLAGDDVLLDQAIAADPVAWLGPEGKARHGGQTPLLVKLLDAADNLSVQVHPDASEPALDAGESGKPEGWYIVEAEPGAGLYLDFRDGVERADVEACLRQGGALDPLMNFVPVSAGDAFRIRSGTVHAVGAGVTLVEPQFVIPGCRAVTYRYWDWNRRYDARGEVSPEGSPRPLHIDRSLAVTRWQGPRGAAAVDACRQRPTLVTPGPLARALVMLCPYFVLERWAGHGVLEVAAQGVLQAVVCVAGAARVHTERGAADIRCGQSMVIPAAGGAVQVSSQPMPMAMDSDAAGAVDGPVELLVTRAV